MIVVKDVRGDMMLKATLRQDLAPIPLTFEGVFRTTTQTAAQFKDGAVLVVNDLPMRIVKAVPQHMADGGVQGKEPFSGTHVIAFPDGLQALALPRTAAAIFEGR